jgi:hypothetical protein
VGVMLLWSSSAMAATLAWNANTELDVAGYKVYQCGTTPCRPGSGAEALIVTLGKVTSYDIGTPSVTKYYYITAYDTANLESGASNVATYTPAGSQTTPPPPSLFNVNLTVLGTPTLGQWGVEGTTTDTRDVMAMIYADGKYEWTDHTAPYSYPASSAAWTVPIAHLGDGLHKIEYVFYLEGTTTEVGRTNITVQEGPPTSTTTSTPTSSPTSTPTSVVTPTVTLTVLGNPAAGQWGVEGKTTDLRDVMATMYVDGRFEWTDHNAPYSFPATSAAWNVPIAHLGAGLHTVEFIFYLEGSSTEVGRASITVKEGP